MKPDLSVLIEQAKARWAAMTSDEKEAMLRAQRDGWVKAELQWAKDFREGKCERD